MYKPFVLILITASIIVGHANEGFAQNCETVQFGKEETALRIAYQKLAQEPLAGILASGEAEYLRNVEAWIGPGWFSRDQLHEFWRRSTQKLLRGGYSTGAITSRDPRKHPYTIFAPETLKRLQACVSASDPKYGHLLRVPTSVPEFLPGELYE